MGVNHETSGKPTPFVVMIKSFGWNSSLRSTTNLIGGHKGKERANTQFLVNKYELQIFMNLLSIASIPSNSQKKNTTTCKMLQFLAEHMLLLHSFAISGKTCRTCSAPCWPNLKVPLLRHQPWRKKKARKHMCQGVPQLLILGMGDLPPLIGNPYNGYIIPYYWVDEFIPYYMEIMGV